MIIHMLCLLFVVHYSFWPVGCDNTHVHCACLLLHIVSFGRWVVIIHAVLLNCGTLFVVAGGP